MGALILSNFAFIITLYGSLIVGCLIIGYFAGWVHDRWRRRRARRIAASRISFDDAFPIIDEWAKRPGNEWYWKNTLLRNAAEIEHARLIEDEPGLTVEQNLQRVAMILRKRYPAAFQTLH